MSATKEKTAKRSPDKNKRNSAFLKHKPSTPLATETEYKIIKIGEANITISFLPL
jgi:hypothetical protein